jgi:hypothetical protein
MHNTNNGDLFSAKVEDYTVMPTKALGITHWCLAIRSVIMGNSYHKEPKLTEWQA